MRIIRKKKKNESGQSLVEFALILPILLALIIAIVDFGWLFMAKITANNAVREVARVYAVHGPKVTAGNPDPKEYAKEIGENAIDYITFSSGPNFEIDEISGEIIATVAGEIEPLIGIFNFISLLNGEAEAVNIYTVNAKAHMKQEFKSP